MLLLAFFFQIEIIILRISKLPCVELFHLGSFLPCCLNLARSTLGGFTLVYPIFLLLSVCPLFEDFGHTHADVKIQSADVNAGRWGKTLKYLMK